MVDKAVSGIGRELRYFEYKFRKNQQRKKKKDKNGNLSNQDLAWSDETPNSGLQSTNAEVRQAMPSSSGEEALQIQVALAMSREEEQERDRQSESDRLRLEMAIKESQQHAEYVKKTEDVKNQPSLLDLSLNAPRPTGVTSSQLPSQQAIPAATNDPWGSSAPSSVSFDPFANQKPVVAQSSAPSAMPLHNTNITSADPWGMPVQTQIRASEQVPAQPVKQDPWGAISAPVAAPAVGNPWGNVAQTAPPNIPQSNGWGGVAQPVQQPAQSQMDAWGVVENPPPALSNQQNGAWAMPTSTPSTTSQNTAWGNPDPFLSLSQPQETQKSTYDPFSGTSSIQQTQPTAMYSTPAVSTPSNAPFSSQTGDIFSAPPFDPLKDFDNLHIGSTELEPVVLSNDLTPGASVAKDLFPTTQTLKPDMASQNINSAPVTQATGALNSNPQNSFLGENSSLVNLDAGWRYQTPYSTKPLGSSSHNPFQQTGPSKTLNEMMGRQSGFQ